MSERYRLLYVVLIVMVCLGSADFLVDHILLGFEINHDLHSAVQATMVGVVGASAAWAIFKGIETQRALEREQVQRLAELNHRLRNSLELIVDAHYLEADEEHKKMIMETVEQMDEAIRQLCPVNKRVP
jgi:hypothetical protein